jgi:hypothetical protein
MQVVKACDTILSQLADLVERMEADDFVTPSAALSRSTVGQHLRHTLEFFVCLEAGVQSGTVNYDKRAHDKIIESDKFLALAAIHRIRDFVHQQPLHQHLKLEVGYERDSEEAVTLDTNYLRELTYNIEHAVHHMAIMKIGVREVAPYVTLPPDFGIAVSTIRYQETSTAARA